MISRNEILAQIPSVDELVNSLQPEIGFDIPRSLIVQQARRVLGKLREKLLSGNPVHDVREELLIRLRHLVEPSIREVVNATGVVLHTNLGRAPLAVPEIPLGYQNLEYDLATGKRGRRDDHISDLIEALLGTTGVVVNNNAAAVLLVLNEFAVGREAIISRGEMVEIGEGFRVSEIMQRAGVVLREVGTTNCTNLDDYREAISSRTGLIVRVHPSNFTIQGYTKQPTLEELSELGRSVGIPVYEDLGSGCVTDIREFGVHEPLVRESLTAGMSLVSFSGDKLLGGPQAGIVAGQPEYVSRLRKNPLFRALRVDKLILNILSAALRNLLFERWSEIPVLRMIRLTSAELRERAERLLPQLLMLSPQIVPGESLIGGGSTPNQGIATSLIVIRPRNVAVYERRLREVSPAVIARIEDAQVMIDLRTVFPSQEQDLVKALLAASDVD